MGDARQFLGARRVVGERHRTLLQPPIRFRYASQNLRGRLGRAPIDNVERVPGLGHRGAAVIEMDELVATDVAGLALTDAIAAGDRRIVGQRGSVHAIAEAHATDPALVGLDDEMLVAAAALD
jgi:hypothetical protein